MRRRRWRFRRIGKFLFCRKTTLSMTRTASKSLWECRGALGGEVHIVTSTVTSAQNIVKCCNRAGLTIGDIILMPLAAAEAVLSGEERELGVALVDIGSGTTDIAVFHDGTVRHSAVLSVGGNHLTNDIAAGLRTPTADAERIKQRYGLAKASTVSGDQRVEVSSVAGKAAGTVSRQILCEIIEPAWKRFFSWCRERSQSRDTRVPWRPESL